jgi:bacterioferritin
VAMKGDATVLKHLNGVLRNELAAINQYFLHARMFDNWGLTKLAAKEYESSIDEMKHADELIQRILLLEGLPGVQDIGKVAIGENAVEALQCDLRLEQAAIPELRAAIAACEAVGDYVSRDLFSAILDSEEEHEDWLDTQLKLCEQIGLQNFLQTWA